MADFSPTTPIGQDVQKLLLENPTGLTLAELRRSLRRTGRNVSEDNLRELLMNKLFVALADGRYVMSGAQIPNELKEAAPESTDGADSAVLPWLTNVPATRDTYVVFDLETTGTNPDQDRIFQIAAAKIVSGRVLDIQSWYVNPAPVEIPYSLQLKLGLIDNPEISQLITASPPLKQILPEFAAFVGHLPLVAHNARFDSGFLDVAFEGEKLRSTVIDTMELALLLFPNAPDHRLETIAECLGLPVDSLATEWEILNGDGRFGQHSVSRETLHNALTDVYVLFRVYEGLLAALRAPGREQALLFMLLPELFNAEDSFSRIDYDVVYPFMEQSDWSSFSAEHGTLVSPETSLIKHLSVKERRVRPGQLEMLALVNEAFERDRFTMIEAPTGTGKTLAYLAPAIYQAQATGQPVALSTAYRNLQDQLLRELEDFKLTSGTTFNSQLIKGVNNYFCWSQILHYLEDGEPHSSTASRTLSLTERFVLAYIILWLSQTSIGTVDTISYWLIATFPQGRGIIDQLRATSACEPELQDTCQYCPMPNAYLNARKADIVVLNHALWLAHPRRMPTFTRIVLDEAHTLEDVATEAFTEEVSSESLHELLDRLFDIDSERGLLARVRSETREAELLSATNGAIGSIRRLKPYLSEFGRFMVQFVRRSSGKIDPRYGSAYRLEAPPWKISPVPWQSLNQAHRQLFILFLGDLHNALIRVRVGVLNSTQLAHHNALLRQLDESIDKLGEQQQLAEDIVRVTDQKLVYWLEVGPPIEQESTDRDPTPTWWAYRRTPINVGEALQATYEPLYSAGFVSATLATRGNDFSYFIDRLGLSSRLDTYFVRQLPPALPYATNALLALVDYLTYSPLERTMQSFIQELGEELKLFLEYVDGRTLGLFTARSRMEAIAELIQTHLARSGIPLYVASPNQSRQRLLEDFKVHTESVLFGLKSFWEGVDAPGETLSFVVMEKLPFPLLISPIHRARAELLQQQGKSEFDDYMLPLMLLQFKQGFGRLLRNESDRGAVILYDRRIHRKHYKGDLLASLPGFVRDADAEKSRRRLFETIAQIFPGLIDLARKSDLLAGLPEDIRIEIEHTLDSFLLPQTVPISEYDQWRPIILDVMQQIFGHAEFRTVGNEPVQEEVIRHILAGDDVLAIMPTGSGKSLTFQLTALLRDGVTLVFSPLIALMKDQVAGLNEAGIELVGAIYSGQTASERDDILDRMQRSRARLIYISPERLRDPQLIAALANTKVLQVVVDEAHCVYMWGQSFRPDFLYVPRLFDVLGYRPPIAALTATATTAIQDAIIDTLELTNVVKIIAPIDRPELRFIVYNEHSRYGHIVSRNDRFKQLLAILQAADRNRPSILIYVATTVEADQIARYLRVAGYDARAYHGKMESNERSSVQEMFMDDHINIVVCTKAFGMGIDKSDIRYVIHYNMPSDLESYFQEAGRAGRDRKTSYCILLYHKSDVETQEYFIENGTPDASSINELRAYLASLPETRLFLNPLELEEALGLEEVQLKVALHHLETQGYVRRYADFSLTATLTIQEAPEEVLEAWSEDTVSKEILHRLLIKTQWAAYRKYEVNLNDLAQQIRVNPTEIDSLLLALSSANFIVYRPWQRGIVIEKLQKLEANDTSYAGNLAAEYHKNEMRSKLNAMIAYAENEISCRASVILDYFGQSVAACGQCDVCQPTHEWPWSLVTHRDFATPDAYADPAFTILEAVKWNLDRARKYNAPYGIGALKAILRGNSYLAVQHETNPHLRKWRLQQMRGCPQWGIFAVLSNADRVLDETSARLLRENFLQEDTFNFEGGTSYKFYDLTTKGIDQLTSGRLLQW